MGRRQGENVSRDVYFVGVSGKSDDYIFPSGLLSGFSIGQGAVCI